MRWINPPHLMTDDVLPPDELATVLRQCRISPPSYLPSPDQILSACQRIQSTWSAKEERSRRASGRRVAWQLPYVSAKLDD